MRAGQIEKRVQQEGGKVDEGRLMIVRSEGCRVAIGLGAVEGIVETPNSGEDIAYLGKTVPTLRLGEISGAGRGPEEAPAALAVLVRTSAGLLGLLAESCLGIRSLGSTPPVPAHRASAEGSVLCHMQRHEGHLELLLEPAALAAAWEHARK